MSLLRVISTMWRLGRPTYWWLGETEPPQPPAGSIHMLQEAQGFANILRAAPWRIGYASGSRRLYTSDNPVSGYLRPVRPWWEGGAFGSLDYYLPLSPDILLKIERRPYADESEGYLIPQGQRRNCDFSEWEVSMARHIISYEATRYLYGEGMVVPKQCAEACLSRVDRAMREFAVAYLGFDPNPPAGLSPSG